MHENVFTGIDASRVSGVPLRGGVEHRQIALLSYLRRRCPGESSGQFLAGDRADMARSCWPGTARAAPRPRSSPRSAGSAAAVSSVASHHDHVCSSLARCRGALS